MYHVRDISRLIALALVSKHTVQQELTKYLLHAKQSCKILWFTLNPAVFIDTTKCSLQALVRQAS